MGAEGTDESLPRRIFHNWLFMPTSLTCSDADPTKVNNNNTPPVFDAAHTATDTAQGKDQTTAKALPSTTTLVTIGSAGSAASGGSMAASADGGDSAAYAGAGVTSMCPVVAFASVAAQMSFKLVLHLAVFGGAWVWRTIKGVTAELHGARACYLCVVCCSVARLCMQGQSLMWLLGQSLCCLLHFVCHPVTLRHLVLPSCRPVHLSITLHSNRFPPGSVHRHVRRCCRTSGSWPAYLAHMSARPHPCAPSSSLCPHPWFGHTMGWLVHSAPAGSQQQQRHQQQPEEFWQLLWWRSSGSSCSNGGAHISAHILSRQGRPGWSCGNRQGRVRRTPRCCAPAAGPHSVWCS